MAQSKLAQMNGSSMMEDLAFDPSLSSSGDQGQDMDLVCQETIWTGIALHLWEPHSPWPTKINVSLSSTLTQAKNFS